MYISVDTLVKALRRVLLQQWSCSQVDAPASETLWRFPTKMALRPFYGGCFFRTVRPHTFSFVRQFVKQHKIWFFLCVHHCCNLMSQYTCCVGIVVFTLVLVCSCSGGDITLVNTTSGEVFGSVENNLRVWRGIPFAEPPIGKSRQVFFNFFF